MPKYDTHPSIDQPGTIYHLETFCCKSMHLVRRGLNGSSLLVCGVISKLTLLLVLAAPVKRKGARGEVRTSRRPRYYVPCSI